MKSLFCPPSPFIGKKNQIKIDEPLYNEKVSTGNHKMRLEDYDFNSPPSKKTILFREINKKVSYRVIKNDGTKQSLIWLISARNIFQNELISMNENYITRLIFNPYHYTLIAISDGSVVGGISFRPFFKDNFAEIAFCALEASFHTHGYGSHMMANFKHYLQTYGIENIFTYADNTAIVFFERNGFCHYSTLPASSWKKKIKDYSAATLLSCFVDKSIDYTRIYEVLDDQMRELAKLLPIIPLHGQNKPKSKSIAGIIPGNIPRINKSQVMLAIVQKIRNDSKSWPFAKRINESDAPNYLKIVDNPMDLVTLENNVVKNRYNTYEHFKHDLMLIFDNCFKFNQVGTVYWNCAHHLLRTTNEILAKCGIE